MARRLRVAIVACTALSLSQCQKPDDSPSSSSTAPQKVELIAAPADGDIAPYLAQQLATARAQNRQLVVYVGASWCEPCQRFHQAAAEGKLDGDFPRLRLVEFDQDRDRERLEAANCHTRMLPMFSAINADGTCAEQRFAGAIKGPGALDVIVPRLKLLLTRGS